MKRSFGPTASPLAAMVVVAVFLATACTAGREVASETTGSTSRASITPAPSVTASSAASHAAVVPATPMPTAEVLSLDLTWTEVDLDAGFAGPADEGSHVGHVAWLGDRFVLVDAAGAVKTSTDGMSWRALQPGDPDPGYADLLKDQASLVTWEDQIVGWSNPQDGPDIAGKPPVTARDILRIVQPPAQPTVTTPFEGRIQWIAIGPAGIVAQTEFWPDDRTVVWAGWFSPDGIEWTAIPTPPGDEFAFDAAVGVSDGFIASAYAEPDDTCPRDCSSMWHSSDGLAWRNLGVTVPESYAVRLVPWKGGALVSNGVGRFGLLTSQGYSELPMAAEFPAPPWGSYAPLATGPLGLVSIRPESKEILFTRDGVDWKIQPMPAAMATFSSIGPTIAVGDRSVLYLTWSGDYSAGERYVPSLWVGSAVP